MAIVAASPEPASPPLEIKGVLRDTTRVYRSLFARSFLTGFTVFAVLGIIDLVGARTHGDWTLTAVGIVATTAAFVGTTFVQGALVDAVDSEHRGVAVPLVGDLYRRSWARLGALVELSLRTGFAVAFALFLFVVPGVLLAVRWALAAPVVMLEGLCARDAMRRSGELVRGHRGAVFRVLLNVWVRVAIAWFLLDRIIVHLSGTMGHPLLSFWIGGALASAVVTPYAGHALSVVYYRLTQPDLPVIAAKRQTWQSVWQEHDLRRDHKAG